MNAGEHGKNCAASNSSNILFYRCFRRKRLPTNHGETCNDVLVQFEDVAAELVRRWMIPSLDDCMFGKGYQRRKYSHRNHLEYEKYN